MLDGPLLRAAEPATSALLRGFVSDRDAGWIMSALMILFLGGGLVLGLWEYFAVRRSMKEDERKAAESRAEPDREG